MTKENPMQKLLFFASIMICIIFTTGCEGRFYPLPYRSLAPFEGKVIDADTKNPVEGAVVLAVYSYEIYGIAGANTIIKDGQETFTDKKGEFRLPRTRRWFVLNRGYPRGELEIFKPGYGTLWHERSKALGDNKSWPTPGKYIIYELPKLETTKERKLNIPRKYVFEEIAYKNQKMYLNAINEERMNLGFKPFSIPK